MFETFPEPAGVCQVPSPLQKVLAVALVPLFRLFTVRFPVTPPAPLAPRLIAGSMDPVIEQGPGVPGAPVQFPNTWLPGKLLVKTKFSTPPAGLMGVENKDAGAVADATAPPPP